MPAASPSQRQAEPLALVLLASGAEEMEVVIVVDVLRRAGVQVTLASIEPSETPVTCSRKVRLCPDTHLEAVLDERYDAVVLPGGIGGAEALAKSPTVGALLRQRQERGELVAAICAAPIALAAHGLMKGQVATCHPSVSSRLEGHFDLRTDRVIRAAGLLTSQGPGTAFEFALHLVEDLCGSERRDEVAAPMML